jgi:hypothetical protein
VGLLALFAFAADEVSGKWTFILDTPGGERRAQSTLAVEGEKVTGKWDTNDVNGTFRGNQLELEFPLYSAEADQKANLKVSAKLENGQFKGTWSWSSYNGNLTGKKE